jgi:hypothetical protein
MISGMGIRCPGSCDRRMGNPDSVLGLVPIQNLGEMGLEWFGLVDGCLVHCRYRSFRFIRSFF